MQIDSRLRCPDVQKALGYRSQTSIYALVKDGLLTKSIPLGPRATGWPTSEISAILTARSAGLGDDAIRALVAQLHDKRQADWTAFQANVGGSQA